MNPQTVNEPVREVQSGKLELPAPLVKPARHPLKWTAQKVELLAAAGVFTYIGILIIAALYYILLETKWKLSFMQGNITQEWHKAVPNRFERHNIRDVGEGFLGGLMAHMIIWNHFKKIRPRNVIDKIEIALRIPNLKDEHRLTGWQLIVVVPLALIYAIPGFLITQWLVTKIHYHPKTYHTGSVVTNIKNGFIENWPKKVMGYGAAFFFGRRPAAAVFDEIQLWFAERRVALKKPLRFYHTPPFKARYNVVSEKGVAGLAKASRFGTGFMLGGLIASVGLAGYGYYVLNYIAK
jgi:hypothetical protein